jgi:hypothetical protein
MHKRYFSPRYRECGFAETDFFERCFDVLTKRKRVTEGKRRKINLIITTISYIYEKFVNIGKAYISGRGRLAGVVQSRRGQYQAHNGKHE